MLAQLPHKPESVYCRIVTISLLETHDVKARKNRLGSKNLIMNIKTKADY